MTSRSNGMEVSVRQSSSSLNRHREALWVGVVAALLLGTMGCGDASRTPVDIEGPTYLPGEQPEATEQSQQSLSLIHI